MYKVGYTNNVIHMYHSSSKLLPRWVTMNDIPGKFLEANLIFPPKTVIIVTKFEGVNIEHQLIMTQEDQD